MGAFTPELAKHTNNLSLVGIAPVAEDRMQLNFEPMRTRAESWKRPHLPDESAKLAIYRAFVGGEMDVLKHLARRVHALSSLKVHKTDRVIQRVVAPHDHDAVWTNHIKHQVFTSQHRQVHARHSTP